jgi:GMP synthase-like glutamine amidotransferase
LSNRPRAVVLSNDEPDSSYGATRLARAFEERFDTELVNPLRGFGDPLTWLERVRAGALVLSGSDRTVLSELPWMIEEEEVLRSAVAAGVPTFAVCFGHQLLAKALGSSIVTMEKRVGLFEVTPVGADRLFEGLEGGAVVPEQHTDQVAELPRGFELIATSDYCRVQAMRHESLPVYGVQFHPCYDEGVFDEDETWGDLNFEGPFEHDGARILANAVESMFASLG